MAKDLSNKTFLVEEFDEFDWLELEKLDSFKQEKEDDKARLRVE